MSLQDFKDNLSSAIYGMTAVEAVAQNVCVRCKETPRFKTEKGRREYLIIFSDVKEITKK